MSNSLERERILENAKTQLELDWRRRLELKENELHNQNEILLQNMRNLQEEVHAVYLLILFIYCIYCSCDFMDTAIKIAAIWSSCDHSGVLSVNTHHNEVT